MKIICPQCQIEVDKRTSRVNHYLKNGLPMYCSMKCAGLARRIERSDEEKKLLKYEYDKKYRVLNKNLLKNKKNEYHKKTYDPQKAAIERKAKMHIHLQRMRQPKWVAYKREYDRVYLAKKKYGEFWESVFLINEIQSLYDDKAVREINDLHNKKQKRKRKWNSQLN